MIPPAFEYHAPASVAEAIALLGRLGTDAKLLAGGHSLLPMMKLRFAQPAHLIDLNRIAGLRGIREQDGEIVIGAMTVENELLQSSLLQANVPLLPEAVRQIADPQVRNRGTIGGDLAHGDPANDHPATMLALRAEVVATGPNGARTIPIDQFFLGLFTTALEADEILTEIRIPAPQAKSGGSYVKLERKVGDFATAASAVQLTLGAGGEVASAGIGLTNAGPTPLRATDAEQYLIGKQPGADVIAEAARLASTIAMPSADRRGAIEYKRQMARVLTARALQRAIQWAREH
jgi:carbon-monoxide dehydrogenase medium subunit